MAGKTVEYDDYTVSLWDKSFAIDGKVVYLDHENPEVSVQQLFYVMEQYRKAENRKRLNQFMQENVE